jgi:REP-associated tyrosine transposase
MSRYIHKSHNVSVLLYHLVFPVKYRRAVFDATVDRALKEVCLEIEASYQVKFGTDKDHVHFLVQSVPTYSVTRLVTGDLPTVPVGEEASVGWGILDGWLFREHRRPPW